MPSYFHPCGAKKIPLYMMPWFFADAASDNSWEVEDRSCQQIHMEWTWYYLSSVLLRSSTRTEVRKKGKQPMPGIQKPLSLKDCLFQSYHYYIMHSKGLGGLWYLITLKLLIFSHCENQHLCWQIKSTVKVAWFSPFLQFSVSFSFSFLPPQVWWLSAIMPVSMSSTAVEQSAGRPVRLPLPPLLRARQQWKDWEGEWWAFNTMHNRAPQPQTGTVFTLS